MRLPLALCCTSLALVTGLHAQSFTTGPCSGNGENTSGRSWLSGHATACETRSTTLPVRDGQLSLTNVNGSIEVLGEDRADIALEATVIAQATDIQRARATLHELSILTAPTIEPRGPHHVDNSDPQWHVSFLLHVPRQLNAHLQTANGSITLTALAGAVDARTTNGALSLRNLAGDITAATTNGGVAITLDGNHWAGKGLRAETTNGAITLRAAPAYSAHLVAQTTHGGIDVAMPATSHGNSSATHVDTNLGQGGAPLHLQTTNGGIRIQQD